MGLHIDLLNAGAEAAYAELVRASPTALIYSSLKYRDFLGCILPDSEPLYLTAYDGDQMVGALPAFLRRNEAFGNVLNALPFYGSHGGPVVGARVPEARAVREALLREFMLLAAEQAAVAATVVSNPLDHDDTDTDDEADAALTFRDGRTSQITPLPVWENDGAAARAALVASWHPKTRYSVRRAEAAAITVRTSGSPDALRTLSEMHRENLEAIGGRAKPWTVFESLATVFAYGEDYDVWLAERDGVAMAALLVLFCGGVAEYFTPAVRAEFRTLQPLSLLIREAMFEALRRGCRAWNWGGTWRTQDALHRFKKRWAAMDRPYTYRTRVFDPVVLTWSPELILREYPYYFVVPFGVLR